MSSLKLFTFGPPRVELDGQPVVLERNKAAALLVYLAVTGQTHSRLALATLLWPDYDQSRAYAYLRTTLWTLNDALGADWIEADRENIAIQAGADLWVDARQFEQMLAACEAHGHASSQTCPLCVPLLEQAAELYTHDFLSGFSLRDSPGFDDWQFFQSESLRAGLAGALQRLADCYSRQGELEAAILNARRWLSLDSLQEEPHRRLMRLYAQAGQRSAALRQYDECARTLQAELGVQPEAETQALYELIKTGQLAKESSPAAPAPAPTRLQVRLPAPPTPFVGREDELAEITGLMENPQCRLLSLVGPGGIGKTRLAIEAAARLVDITPGQAAEGVYFVPLAALSSADSLVPAIGDVLGLSFRSEEVLGIGLESKTTQLIDYLRPRKVLLVLDNFEQLISGADLLRELVTEAPELSILVTSRERLSLPGEWVLQVGSLQVPNGAAGHPLESYSAVKLFLQCAQRARVGFTLSATERPWVARICRLVDGFPLGIELAAAWVKMLSCQEIAAEIQRSLDFLAAQRGLPDRHQSLRAVFNHSWELLSEREKCTFSRLSVFRGPFRREAAEALLDCDPLPGSGESNGPPQGLQGSALMLLAALVDKSLLRRADDGRYEMHELLKQYAAERLANNPREMNLARDQHALYYQLALDNLREDLAGAGLRSALRWIEGEFEDIRAAWRWCLSQGEFSSTVQMGNLMAHYYTVSNRFQEALQDYEFVISSVGELERAGKASQLDSQAQRAKAYALAWGWSFAANLGEVESVESYRRECFSLAEHLPPRDRASLYLTLQFGAGLLEDDHISNLYRISLDQFIESGDRRSQSLANLVYGDVLVYTSIQEDHKFEHALELYQEGLAIARQVGDPWSIAYSLLALAHALYFSRGSYDQARTYLLEALEIARQLEDSWQVIGILFKLGQVTTALGDYEQAKACYQECMPMLREKGDRRMTAITLSSLGHVHYLLAEYDQAQEAFEEALAICRATGNEHEMGFVYGNLGNVRRALGDRQAARQYYRQSVELLERSQDDWGLCLNLKRQGILYTEMGELDEAWVSFRRAIQLATLQDLPPEMLEILLGIAGLAARQGEPVRAVELASLALAHAATAMDARENAMQLLAEIEDRLPEADFEAAQQSGRTMDLYAAAEQYLGDASEQGGEASK